ncbi:MAG: toll/interleukin-1 receptor domain-containing protein [Planctomycetes bacterium]|nr:toll/interleukin-1 receptor domain-containing protein [Planctomycetota bacterium]
MMAHDLIISYAKKDKPIADAACARLEAAGIRCWIAPRDIQPGMEWGAAIMSAIESTQVLVLIFSRSSNVSKQVLREVEGAVRNDKVIIPFRTEEFEPSKSMEYYLSVPHWLDALTPPLEAHIDRLVATLRGILYPEDERLPSDPGIAHPRVSEATLRAMCWDGRGRWQFHPMEVMGVRAEKDHLEITNRVTFHYHARVVLDQRLTGDFSSELVIQGRYCDLQMVAADGEDRVLYANPSAQGIDTDAVHTYRVNRRAGKVEFRLAEDRVLRHDSYLADAGMDCYLSIAFRAGESFRLYFWSIR